MASTDDTTALNTMAVSVKARALSESLPDLLVEARRLAQTVTAGWHGRKRAGPGETFWQFRPFHTGEPVKRIDWRRSARDTHLYVREREWEAAHTLWLWADLSESMQFRSRLSATTKQHRALLLQLTLANLLGDAGERVGVPDVVAPTASRNLAEKIATALLHHKVQTAYPSAQNIRRFSDVLVFSDFLDPPDVTVEWIRKVAATGAKGHLVHILDPIEETFPFNGRMEFRDPETGSKLLAGRAEEWRRSYQDILAEHKHTIRSAARSAGWSYIEHHTDHSPNEPLLFLHARLGDDARAFGGSA
ncbi:DUF58 domain-containing protein [Pseudovibrio exalbescens]|uniref:DUF58 domain-containing protein n=1 Tax=Pseudovibrio exalbescens TaxID=197461 RepID=A0A1U7JLC1_9HYPH|nr:DUF58 domain-containing protein [Pseudovibrio exalbescens]OKL45540.1 hypothetical protein A3843_04295 [Pseudovibrio exalbescens]